MARKSPAQKIKKIRQVIRAWEGIAPKAVFFGMTLEQFKTAVRPSEETRTELDSLRHRTNHIVKQRDVCDIWSMQLIEGIQTASISAPDRSRQRLILSSDSLPGARSLPHQTVKRLLLGLDALVVDRAS